MANETKVRTKKSHIGTAFLKRTAGLITGAAGDYISEAMPVTSSVYREAKESAKDGASFLINTSKEIFPKARQIKKQLGLKKVLDWYMGEEDELSDDSEDSNIKLDIDTDEEHTDIEIANTTISETEKASNKMAKALVSSSKKQLQGQIELTSNIITSIDKQTEVISGGFNKLNKTLEGILEVVTKNTAAIVEATVANGNNEPDHRHQLLDNGGKFNFKQYIDMIKKNASEESSSSMFGMILPYLSMLKDKDTRKQFLSPESITKLAFGGIMNKFMPGIKEGLKALDESFNESLMTGLIRLGENRGSGLKGTLARIFGIDSTKKDFTVGEKKELELKAVAFDSITKEAITNTIPGYLKRILEAVGGKSLEYDYRARKFKTKEQMQRDFMNVATGSNHLSNASEDVRRTFGGDGFAYMLYDMIITDLGYETGDGRARDMIASWATNPNKFEKYVKGIFANHGMQLKKQELNRVREIAKNMGNPNNTRFGAHMSNDIAVNNHRHNQRIQKNMEDAANYNLDYEGFSTDRATEIKNLAKIHGKKFKDNTKAGASISASPNNELMGVNYTNKALYEIFQLLNRGINVYRVGKDDSRKKQFPKWKLTKPSFMRQSQNKQENEQGPETHVGQYLLRTDGTVNLLNEEFDEDGNELTKGKRFARWAKQRGGALTKAIFSGDKDAIKAAFGNMVGDISEVARDSIKKGLSKVNDSFGNVTGFLKHKFFGTEYSYQDGTDENGNPIMKHIKANEKGGYFGFVKDYFKDIFKEKKEQASKWFNSVKGYFNYADDKDADKSVVSKRQKLISTTVGAFAGMGILGGPLGLIAGALAGNALVGTNFSQKIKSFLFGDKEKGKKGLLGRVGDHILDPIRYQMSKTTHYIAEKLKKNIIGPLSDIGVAIRERITSSAKSVFTKVFGAIGKMLMAPFKAVGKLFRFPTALLGKAVRGTAGAAGSVTGFGLNRLAGIIAGKGVHTFIDENGEEQQISTKDYLKQRRKERKSDFKSNKKFTSYKDWKEDRRQKRADRFAKLKNYTSEVEYTEEEWAAKQAEIQQHQAEIAEKHKDIAERTYETNQEISQKLDQIIGLNEDIADNSNDDVTKPKKKRRRKIKARVKSSSEVGASINTAQENENLGNVTEAPKQKSGTQLAKEREEAERNYNEAETNAELQAMSNIAGTNGYDQDDVRDIQSAVDLTGDTNSKPSLMRRLFKKVLKRQGKSVGGAGIAGKSKDGFSLWDAIKDAAGFLGDHWKEIAAILAGLAILKDPADAADSLAHQTDAWVNGDTVKRDPVTGERKNVRSSNDLYEDQKDPLKAAWERTYGNIKSLAATTAAVVTGVTAAKLITVPGEKITTALSNAAKTAEEKAAEKALLEKYKYRSKTEAVKELGEERYNRIYQEELEKQNKITAEKKAAEAEKKAAKAEKKAAKKGGSSIDEGTKIGPEEKPKTKAGSSIDDTATKTGSTIDDTVKTGNSVEVNKGKTKVQPKKIDKTRASQIEEANKTKATKNISNGTDDIITKGGSSIDDVTDVGSKVASNIDDSAEAIAKTISSNTDDAVKNAAKLTFSDYASDSLKLFNDNTITLKSVIKNGKDIVRHPVKTVQKIKGFFTSGISNILAGADIVWSGMDAAEGYMFGAAYAEITSGNSRILKGDYTGGLGNAGGKVMANSVWKYVGATASGLLGSASAAILTSLAGGPLAISVGIGVIATMIIPKIIGYCVTAMQLHNTDINNKEYSVRSNSAKIDYVISRYNTESEIDPNNCPSYIYCPVEQDRVLTFDKGVFITHPEVYMGTFMEAFGKGGKAAPGADILLFDWINNMAVQGVPFASYIAGDSAVVDRDGFNFNSDFSMPHDSGNNRSQVTKSIIESNKDSIFGEMSYNIDRMSGTNWDVEELKSHYNGWKVIINKLASNSIINANHNQINLRNIAFGNDAASYINVKSFTEPLPWDKYSGESKLGETGLQSGTFNLSGVQNSDPIKASKELQNKKKVSKETAALENAFLKWREINVQYYGMQSLDSGFKSPLSLNSSQNNKIITPNPNNYAGWVTLLEIGETFGPFQMLEAIFYINSHVDIDDNGNQWVEAYSDFISILFTALSLRNKKLFNGKILDEDKIYQDLFTSKDKSLSNLTDKVLKESGIDTKGKKAESSGGITKPVSSFELSNNYGYERLLKEKDKYNIPKDQVAKISRGLRYITASYLYSNPKILKKLAENDKAHLGVDPSYIQDFNTETFEDDRRRQIVYNAMASAALKYANTHGDIFNLVPMIDWKKYAENEKVSNYASIFDTDIGAYGNSTELETQWNRSEFKEGNFSPEDMRRLLLYADDINGQASGIIPEILKHISHYPSEGAKKLAGANEFDWNSSDDNARKAFLRFEKAMLPYDKNLYNGGYDIPYFPLYLYDDRDLEGGDVDELLRYYQEVQRRNKKASVTAKSTPVTSGVNSPSDATLAYSGKYQVGKTYTQNTMGPLSFENQLKLKSGTYTNPNKKTSLWDRIATGIKSLAKKGGASLSDDLAFNFAHMGGDSSSGKVGGNPLSKPFEVSSPYGDRDGGFHRGIDLITADHTGEAEVSARYSGTVTEADTNVPDSDSGYPYQGNHSRGNTITIQTDDGQMQIKVMHLKGGSVPSDIKVGSKIQIGQKLGNIGSTGSSTGPHLHYQLEKNDGNGNFVDYDPASDVQGEPHAPTLGGSSVDTTSETSSQVSGPIGKLIEGFKKNGHNFLDKISGGMFGEYVSVSDEGVETTGTATSSGGSGLTNSSGNDHDADKNAARVYKRLKSLGISDINIAGALGNFKTESGVDPTSVEGFYGDHERYEYGPDKQKAMNDHESYFWNLKSMYDNNGLSINTEAYKGEDGKYYPGLGLAQFTGPAATQLIDKAKSLGMNWYDMDANLAYGFPGANDSGPGYRSWFTKDWTDHSSVSDATRYFLKNYEGCTPNSTPGSWPHIETRVENANYYYDKMKNGWPNNTGGPSYGADSKMSIIGGNPLSKSAKITSGFGSRAEMGDFHRGIDITPADGSDKADVKSQFNGTVLNVKNNVPDSDSGYPYHGKNSTGNAVSIQTDSGQVIKNYHLKAGSIPANIKPGMRIGAGDKIGEIGSTGNSTGPHLHYQIENGNSPLSAINPLGGAYSSDDIRFNFAHIGGDTQYLTRLGTRPKDLKYSSTKPTQTLNSTAETMNSAMVQEYRDYLIKRGYKGAELAKMVANYTQEITKMKKRGYNDQEIAKHMGQKTDKKKSEAKKIDTKMQELTANSDYTSTPTQQESIQPTAKARKGTMWEAINQMVDNQSTFLSRVSGGTAGTDHGVEGSTNTKNGKDSKDTKNAKKTGAGYYADDAAMSSISPVWIPKDDQASYNDPNNFFNNTNNYYSNNSNNENLEKIMTEVLQELRILNGTASSSNSWLESINGKEFKDQGLRDSINALGKATSRSKTTNSKRTNVSNAKTVYSMARP